MVEKQTASTDESVEAKSDYGLNRRTFAKGTGATLALASSFGTLGGTVGAQDDDTDADDDTVEINGLDDQFRQMEREMYVSALVGQQANSDGSGVGVFLPEEAVEDTEIDDNGVDDNDVDADEDDDNGVDDNGIDDNDDDNDVDNEIDDEDHRLQYHVFLMNVDGVTAVNLREGAEGEDGDVVESLFERDEEMDDNGIDDNDVHEDDGEDFDDDDENGIDDNDDDDDFDDNDEDNGVDDDDENGIDDNGAEHGLSGTIEEPIVITGVIGNGVGANGVDDDDDTDVDGEALDIEDFKANPWNYHISVEGDDNGLDDEDDNGVDDEEFLLRGQVTTGLLAEEDDIEDPVDDDDDVDDNGVDDDDENGIGDDDDNGVDDNGVDDDDDENGIGDDDDDNGV